MAEPVGDLVVDLSLDAARFDEQMARVRRHFSGTESDAKKTAAVVEQSLSRQALAAQKAGISVGQYKAAMRMLPAQFTDVATQLAGGQSPWLILLQQGGQVKDSFGGMIPMFRGLAGAITLPMVGATSLAVATGALAYAWYQGNSTLSDFNKTLVLSGNQAGLTADRMLVLSRAGQAAGLTFNQTSESLSALVKAGVSGEAQIASISQSVARFSSASGVEVDKVAEAFGKLTTDPTSGLTAMARQFHNVSAEQIAYVAQLQRSGDEAGALQAANEAATKGFDDQTRRLKENMGTLETWADRTARAFKSMWDAVLDIGRPDTAQEMLIKAEAAYKKADDIWNLRKDDYFVNDEARARYWDDREKARLALEAARKKAEQQTQQDKNAQQQRRLQHLNPGCDNQQRRRRVTAELRNLPHIASMAFNEPLMLEPAYARVFFCALAGQLGISSLTDAVSGDSLTAQEALATLALSGDDDGPRQARSYQVMNGIAVLPVSGTLVSRTRALQPYSGMTGYNGIIARLQQAASDPMVDGILLDMDTPGGMVAGAFDCADIIARVRDIKPVWALANDMNCSAGQLLASAASRRLVTQTARTGSIGVMMAHSNYGAALEKQGVEITLIYSGSHKVDGNPYSHLPDDVRETLQSRMDATRQMFAQKVSAYTGLSVQVVLDTEAAVYSGQEAIDAGLADELVNSTDAITVMRDALDARKSRLSGGRMTKETQSTTVSATASQADVTDVVPATEGENASAAQPDVNAQITAAVAAENSRIMGILNCEEAHGREEQARVLAETPGMTVKTARRILAAAPQSAQARSDTALDRLMQGAPAPLAAGNPASDAVNDLLNTPV